MLDDAYDDMIILLISLGLLHFHKQILTMCQTDAEDVLKHSQHKGSVKGKDAAFAKI
jgi:hypothetical protein